MRTTVTVKADQNRGRYAQGCLITTHDELETIEGASVAVHAGSAESRVLLQLSPQTLILQAKVLVTEPFGEGAWLELGTAAEPGAIFAFDETSLQSAGAQFDSNALFIPEEPELLILRLESAESLTGKLVLYYSVARKAVYP